LCYYSPCVALRLSRSHAPATTALYTLSLHDALPIWADGDIAGQHRRRRDVGRLRHPRALQPVLREHRTTPDHRRRNRILLRTHIHHLTPFAAEHTGTSAQPVPAAPLSPSSSPCRSWSAPSSPPVIGSARQESTKTVALGAG